MNKKCKYCKSEISEDCTKCPVCKEWQSKLKNPTTISSIIFVFIILTLFIGSRYYMMKTIKLTSKHFTSATDHKLQILWHKVMVEDNNKYIIGEIKNNGQDSFNSLEIGAEFYDKKNEIIKLGSVYISSPPQPGTSKKFQIYYKNTNCNGVVESYPDFDNYKLAIDGGMIDIFKKE